MRLGNLFNSEIFGQATTLPWGFEFVRSHKWVAEFAPAAVHPTQIYEALCYLATFGILCWLYYRRDIARRRPGILFGIGLIGTFLTRFFIEYIKTEQEPFEVGWALDMGQWLSIPFILLGIYMIWRGATRPEPFRVRCRKPRPQRLKRRKNEREPDGRADRQACRQPAGRGRGDFSAWRRLALHRAQGARRLNRRTVLPPSRTVAFTSQQRGVSLVDEIARVMREAGGYENPEAEAQAVYDRWIARVHRVDLLTVEGVGELKFKNFIPDEAFDLRLNPQGREPVRVRVQRRFDWPLWVRASRQSGLRRSMAGGSSCCSIRRRRKRRP